MLPLRTIRSVARRAIAAPRPCACLVLEFLAYRARWHGLCAQGLSGLTSRTVDERFTRDRTEIRWSNELKLLSGRAGMCAFRAIGVVTAVRPVQGPGQRRGWVGADPVLLTP